MNFLHVGCVTFYTATQDLSLLKGGAIVQQFDFLPVIIMKTKGPRWQDVCNTKGPKKTMSFEVLWENT